MQKKLILLGFGLGICQILWAQKITTDVFVRIPHVVNYNVTEQYLSYTSVVSGGITLHHGRKFIDLGTFIDKTDTYGFYTFFGSTLYVTPLDEQWQLSTNWFGEVTFVPEQEQRRGTWIQTAGLCLVLARPFQWGVVSFPFCVGGAYSRQTLHVNTRLIFNCSIPIK
jgi:hypothetical protein